ncbi:MAG: CADD family putative folate metabolism protein [Pseudobdellovibrionaceae bacterium]
MTTTSIDNLPTPAPFAIPQDLFLLKHPFYQAWMEGKLNISILQDYVGQYFHHVEAFPQYLQNALENTTQPVARQILAENLAEEDGTAYGTSHPELWLRFADGIGADRAEVRAAKLRQGIRNVVDTFTTFSKGSLGEALGSLYAYESQVPEVAASKIEGLQKNYGINDERTLSFFEVHKVADVAHRESVMQLIQQLPADEKQKAQHAADVSCQALWDFLTDVHNESGLVHAC